MITLTEKRFDFICSCAKDLYLAMYTEYLNDRERTVPFDQAAAFKWAIRDAKRLFSALVLESTSETE